jgi:hypothetical protein
MNRHPCWMLNFYRPIRVSLQGGFTTMISNAAIPYALLEDGRV